MPAACTIRAATFLLTAALCTAATAGSARRSDVPEKERESRKENASPLPNGPQQNAATRQARKTPAANLLPASAGEALVDIAVADAADIMGLSETDANGDTDLRAEPAVRERPSVGRSGLEPEVPERHAVGRSGWEPEATEASSEFPADERSSGFRNKKPDCSHFVHLVYSDAGLDYTYHASRELYRGVPEFVPVKKPQPGDLIVWRGHVGIVVSRRQKTFFSSVNSGILTESWTARHWLARGRPRFFRYRLKPDTDLTLLASAAAASDR